VATATGLLWLCHFLFNFIYPMQLKDIY
jgi:hypothetical protein